MKSLRKIAFTIAGAVLLLIKAIDVFFELAILIVAAIVLHSYETGRDQLARKRDA